MITSLPWALPNLLIHFSSACRSLLITPVSRTSPGVPPPPSPSGYSPCGHPVQDRVLFSLVCLLVRCCLTATLRNPRVPAVGAALLHLKKASSPRKYERQTHPSFQPRA